MKRTAKRKTEWLLMRKLGTNSPEWNKHKEGVARRVAAREARQKRTSELRKARNVIPS